MIRVFGPEISPQTAGRSVLGGKGYGLARMHAQGVPVPPAWIIPTDACMAYLNGDETVLDDVMDEYVSEVVPAWTEAFGYMPLVSVRSGARVSMPGMMDTLLNVGMDEMNADDWADRLGVDAASDCRDRLRAMWADVVGQGDVDTLGAFVQVREAIKAVWRSWNNPRAIEYRHMHGYSDDWGTAVIVQCMVFGNLGDTSCSGVMFTRDPSTGENTPVGEFLPNAQGEDVVAGTHTPLPLADLQDWNPEVYKNLIEVSGALEWHMGDMQDIEFTVQDGDLWILQTRDGKRSPEAGFRIALDMIAEDRWDLETALTSVTLSDYLSISNVAFVGEPRKPDGVGIPAGGPVVMGKAVFSAKAAVVEAQNGPVILITRETDPNDVAGMAASVGILTSTGGMTSHAAVVSRGFGKTCVVGVTDLKVSAKGAEFPGGEYVTEGGWVAIDGRTGAVWFNSLPDVDTIARNHAGRELIRMAMEQDGVLPVGEVEDALKYRTVIRAREWEDFQEGFLGMVGEALDVGVSFSNLIVDLRDGPKWDAADYELLGYAQLEVVTEGDRHRWITDWLGLPLNAEQVEGIQFISDLPGLPGIRAARTIDDLLEGGAVHADTLSALGSPEAIRVTLRALREAGHEVASLFQGCAPVSEAAHRVLD